VSSNKTIFLDRPLRAVKLRSFSISSSDFENAKKKAFDQGHEEASTQFNQQIVNHRQETQSLQEQTLNQIQEKFKSLTQEISERLPNLVVTLTRKTLGGIELDQEKIDAIIQESLKEISNTEESLTLFLSEKDYETMSKVDESFSSKYPSIKFEKDESLNSGDCIIKNSFGLIDGRIDTKLNKVTQELQSE
tara:strand:- start:8417 stop:8989 length:573 start_codon:yes stop_codon:yes gene_type:complete